MTQFINDFIEVFNLSILGIYQHMKLPKDEIYCETLKRALDKSAFMNFRYGLKMPNGEDIMPTNETELILWFQNSIAEIVEYFPQEYKSKIMNSNLAHIEALIILEMNNAYTVTEEFRELFYRRELNKSKDKQNQVIEYQGQKFYMNMLDGTQEQYEEIRSFFIQPSNTYLHCNLISQTVEQYEFSTQYSDLVEDAYELLEPNYRKIFICPVCGLVLKEKSNKILNCINEHCKEKSQNFINAKTIKVPGPIKVLKDEVAHNIYYPGQLERKIKALLDKTNVSYCLWPNKDEFDFCITFAEGEKWYVDAKVVRNPYWIANDIEKNQVKYFNNSAEKIIYVVPTYRRMAYLNVVNIASENLEKIECMTLKSFEKELNSRLERK